MNEQETNTDLTLTEVKAQIERARIRSQTTHDNTGKDFFLGKADGLELAGIILAGVTEPQNWQPIETYQVPYSTYSRFIGGNEHTGFVGDCSWSIKDMRFKSHGSVVELTHWQPYPKMIKETLHDAPPVTRFSIYGAMGNILSMLDTILEEKDNQEVNEIEIVPEFRVSLRKLPEKSPWQQLCLTLSRKTIEECWVHHTWSLYTDDICQLRQRDASHYHRWMQRIKELCGFTVAIV